MNKVQIVLDPVKQFLVRQSFQIPQEPMLPELLGELECVNSEKIDLIGTLFDFHH